MSARRALAIALGGAALVASSARAARAVEHGTEDRATTHAVAIAVGSPASSAFRCSGVLVSANVVVTARHCVAKVTAPPRACDATLGDADVAPSDLWVDVAPWTGDGATWKRAAALRLPETRELCGDDVALVILDAPVSEHEAVPARPVLRASEFDGVVAARTLGLAAFGDTGPNAHDAGTRRSRFDLPVGCVPGAPGFDCTGALEVIGVREFTTTGGVCSGDSGAGAIASDHHDVVFGILSRSARGTEPDASTCAYGIFTRTDAWAWLIARVVLESATPTAPAPAWAQESFPRAPRAGEFCIADAVCADGARCVSFDGRRSFECAATCTSDATCESDHHCEDGVCARGRTQATPSSHGCALSAERPSGAWIVLLVLGLITRRDRSDRARAFVCLPHRRPRSTTR